MHHLRKKNPAGAERVAIIDRRPATYVASAKVLKEGVQEALD